MYLQLCLICVFQTTLSHDDSLIMIYVLTNEYLHSYMLFRSIKYLFYNQNVYAFHLNQIVPHLANKFKHYSHKAMN